MRPLLIIQTLAVSLIAFTFLLLPGVHPAHAEDFGGGCTSAIDGKNEAELQAILELCEAEINKQKDLLANSQKTSTTLEQGIKAYTDRIKKAELDIKARAIKIRQLGDTITVKAERIGDLSSRLDRVQSSMGELVRKTREYQDVTPIETFLSDQDLSNFFADLDSFVAIKDDLRKTFLEVHEVKNLTEKEKKDLETKKAQEQSLKFSQEAEKRKSENYRQEQARILAVTRGQETAYIKDIAEKERIKNEIRNRIFRTVGGTEIKFGDALKLIQSHEATIGVASALVLAVLTQESSMNGNIGGNIGRCTYNQAWNNSTGTVMSPTQQTHFLAILSELGLNPDKIPVSCPISKDGEFGGAIGPAQFMPQTWSGFKNRIGNVLGISTPSPFQNLDAFTGTALYLSDAQTRCKTAFSTTVEIWRCSAAKYYAGLTVSGTRLSRHMNPSSSYGYQVAKRAQQFQKDIDTLDL